LSQAQIEARSVLLGARFGISCCMPVLPTTMIRHQPRRLSFNIIAPEERSDTVSVVLTNGCDPDAMRACARRIAALCSALASAIGELSCKAFRVAHMGHVNAPMLLGTLSMIEMTLGAMGIPHGSGGVQTAIAWLGQQVGSA
jgi:alanine-glyoxylate transaminase/serine-glyoxylate transaminase/serine-pyruvate transaminase